MAGESTYRNSLLKYLSFRLEATADRTLQSSRKRLLAAMFFVLVFVAAVPLFGRFFFQKSLFLIGAPIHANLEIFCGFISIIIAFILFWEYSASGKAKGLFLVLSFLSMGILDIFHALSDHDHNMFVWFHSFSAFFGAVFLFLAIFSKRAAGVRDTTLWERRLHGLLGVAVVFFFAYLSIRLNASLPNVLTFEMPIGTSVSDAKGTFSNFIYGLNLLSGLLFLGAGVLFTKNFFSTNDIVFLVFASSTLLFSESEILFAFSKLWDPMWWYWHVIKVIIFSGLLIGIAYGFTQTVQKLYTSRKELATLVENIEEKNRQIRTAFDRLKETQKYLKESEKLASIGKVAASLAHEIRNPLGAISNSIGVFRRHCDFSKPFPSLRG